MANFFKRSIVDSDTDTNSSDTNSIKDRADTPSTRPVKKAHEPKSNTAQDEQSAFEAMGGMLAMQFSGISLYVVVMLLLAGAIVYTGMSISLQVQRYYEHYAQLQTLKKEHQKLEIEHQRLLIEQQTFSATPQIARRAITQMGMYAPQNEDKLILHPTSVPSIAPPHGNPQTSHQNHPQNQPQNVGSDSNAVLTQAESN